MPNEETILDREKRFAQIWVESRAAAGKTQDFMAKGLGVSKKTIQNWENGVTAPDLFMGSEWFRVLGINPLPYYLSFLFPSLFEEPASDDEDEVMNQALTAIIRNSTTAEKRQLLFLITGKHGSSWYSLLQMFTAHCHTSMKTRVNVSRIVLDSYEIEEATNSLVCPDEKRH